MVQSIGLVLKLTKKQPQVKYFLNYNSFASYPVHSFINSHCPDTSPIRDPIHDIDVGLVGSMYSSQSGSYTHHPTALHT